MKKKNDEQMRDWSLLINTQEEKRCILVGAGEWNIDRLENLCDEFVIAVDGGTVHCRENGVIPDFYIGDFDSLIEPEREYIRKIRIASPDRVCILPVEKDDTDMLAAIKEGIGRGMQQFEIYGGMGKRLDHTIANLQCLLYLCAHGKKGYLIDQNCVVTVLQNETLKLKKPCAAVMSIFSMNGSAEGVSIRGMKYPLTNATVTSSFPIGISNEFQEEEATVTVEKGTLLLIIQRKNDQF